MNHEPIKQTQKPKTKPAPIQEEGKDDFDFEFKPITSGLGFHQPKTPEIKPVFTDRIPSVPSTPVGAPLGKKEMNVYQNDLSLFYGQASASQPTATLAPSQVEAEEVVEEPYRTATRSQRVFAYVTDLTLICSVLGIVLTVMARTISMDLLEVWSQFPNEITPLVITLFCGFYLMYFSIFEKASQSTLGKNLFHLRVLGTDDRPLALSSLLLRSVVSLLNFVSLGLFSYFDLQNKVTGSKVVRVD